MQIRDLKQVGEVPVDTGRVAIIDPAHLEAVHQARDLCHVQKTTLGDGTYPVFTFTGDDGHHYLAVRLSMFPNENPNATTWEERLGANAGK